MMNGAIAQVPPMVWEAMLDDPPPMTNSACRDLYDQVWWVANGQPLVDTTEDTLGVLFLKKEHWKPACVELLVELITTATRSRIQEIHDALCKEHDWTLDEVETTAAKFRKYHLFKVERVDRWKDNRRVLRIPPSARDRLQGRVPTTNVSPTQAIEELLVLYKHVL